MDQHTHQQMDQHTSTNGPTHINKWTNTHHRMGQHTSTNGPTHTSTNGPTHINKWTNTHHQMSQHTSTNGPTHTSTNTATSIACSPQTSALAHVPSSTAQAGHRPCLAVQGVGVATPTGSANSKRVTRKSVQGYMVVACTLNHAACLCILTQTQANLNTHPHNLHTHTHPHTHRPPSLAHKHHHKHRCTQQTRIHSHPHTAMLNLPRRRRTKLLGASHLEKTGST